MHIITSRTLESRRRFLRQLAAGGAFYSVSGLFAEALTFTPRTTAGPFYPDHLPLDQDNDLIKIKDDITPAVGTITNLGGRILDKDGAPLKGVLVELWQADDLGSYIHTRGAQRGQRDAHFQGYGKFETASDGGWRFRTIKPGLYTGRTRHYHFGITLPGEKRRFTSQLFFAGEPGNDRDMVLQGIRDAAQRASVIREFTSVPDTKELATTWDIVMGLTPSDGHDEPDGPPPGPGGPGGDRPPRARDGQRPPPPPDGVRRPPVGE
jgi:protocatechuate 3,4-dioxygenase beta subunit